MAATCEVGLAGGVPCGVLAVGRCSSCGRAFCPTHRVVGFVDFCVSCETDRVVVAQAQRADAEQRKHAAEVRLADAVAALLAKGSHAARALTYPNIERRRFRGYRTVMRPSRYSGWEVGTFTWRWFGRTHQRDDSGWHQEERATAVTTDGKIVGLDTWNHGAQGAWREAGAEGIDTQDLADGTRALDAIAARLRELAADG